MVLMRVDRTLEFHAQYGCHFKARIPQFGRDMRYDDHSCDLLIAASGPEIYRLNLDQGTPICHGLLHQAGHIPCEVSSNTRCSVFSDHDVLLGCAQTSLHLHPSQSVQVASWRRS